MQGQEIWGYHRLTSSVPNRSTCAYIVMYHIGMNGKASTH